MTTLPKDVKSALELSLEMKVIAERAQSEDYYNEQIAEQLHNLIKEAQAYAERCLGYHIGGDKIEPSR